MRTSQYNILLAEADLDDNALFKKALNKLRLNANLTWVTDGVHLFKVLKGNFEHMPDAIFQDLSMPRKKGFTCVKEIRADENLAKLPVVILSTSFEESIADLL